MDTPQPSATAGEPPPQTGGLTVAGLSDVGLKRNANEDRWASFPTRWGTGLLVADGMGGHRGGERASAMVAELMQRQLVDSVETEPESAVRSALSQTNTRIYTEGHGGAPEIQGMGSTLVMALIFGRTALIAHCGDSRAYLFRDGRLTRLTEDHTVGNRMRKSGILTDAQAFNHPDSSVLTRSVGAARDIEPTISTHPGLRDRDVILLCSDGLSGHVSDREIEKKLAACPTLEAMPRGLIDLALAHGGSDNITAVVASFGSYSPPAMSGFRTFLRYTPLMPVSLLCGSLAIIGGGLYLNFKGSRGGIPAAVATTVTAAPIVSGPALPAPPPLGSVAPAHIIAAKADTAHSELRDAGKSLSSPTASASGLKDVRLAVQIIVPGNKMSEQGRRLQAILEKSHAVTRNKNLKYQPNVYYKERTDTYDLLERQARGPVTIFHNDALCTPEYLESIRSLSREAAGSDLVEISFKGEQLGSVGRRQWKDVGVLIVLR